MKKGSRIQGVKDSSERPGRNKKQTFELLNPRILGPSTLSSPPVKIYFISLGCAKNQVDSEMMLHQLTSNGFSIAQEPDEAEVVIINTCSFIESATQESIETILEAARLKKEGACQILVVTGCFPQRYQERLIMQMPEVDLFLGTESFLGLTWHLQELLTGKKKSKMILKPDPGLWEESHHRLLTTSPGTAYLKIAEGCSNGCAYCTIPSIRGKFRSRDPKVLVQEAQVLAGQGIKELILVAQDTTAYGYDLRQSASLIDLLKKILKIKSFQWLRLLYLRPERITQGLLDLIAQEKRICPYFDLPIQHISDHILKAMNRPYGQKTLRGLIKKIHSKVPEAALRTTLMVGFPGERDEDFQELLQFVAETAFDHLGVFKYSPEEGTPAAGYSDQVPEEIGQRRMELLMSRQKEISLKKNQSRISSVEPVLISGISPESDLLIEGRTRFQAPEVDGVVFITDGAPQTGEMVKVKITEAHAYDLVGVAVD
ncbi:MAG: 30S ribosomal protein S12 methylthiotransferase RimO [Thermodesulfobacteriota bacterium]